MPELWSLLGGRARAVPLVFAPAVTDPAPPDNDLNEDRALTDAQVLAVPRTGWCALVFCVDRHLCLQSNPGSGAGGMGSGGLPRDPFP